ncbi:unnamed protein product [Anisakis simplex]|uniref:ULD domain-containing protein n=1 Tax=Anisakis simplex TaxID=6269 RepID=A0A0M3JWZ5_ANISI|nr:unnamed protein product [Anisakis simplex]
MSMFPVRVVVESVRPQHCLTCAHDGHMLVDSYAIVSGATSLSQLVDTVLSALGMPQLAVHSRGLFRVTLDLFIGLFVQCHFLQQLFSRACNMHHDRLIKSCDTVLFHIDHS